MSKYIIKNCPIQKSQCHECYKYCYDCTDCVMKRIVELCKERVKGRYSDTYNLAGKILKLLDIQEVE